MIVLIVALLTTAGAMAQNLPRSPFDWIIAKRLTVQSLSLLTGNVTTGADVEVGGDLAVTGATAVDDATVGGFLGLTPQTVIAVSNNSVITPTGGLQYLASAAVRGTRLVVTTTVPAGTVQMFYNSGSFTITLTDTAPLLLDGNVVLEPKNTLTLLHNGSAWVELARADVHVP